MPPPPHPPAHPTQRQLLGSIRLWLTLFIFGLILSGVTACPLEHETGWLATFATRHPILPDGIVQWFAQVHQALHQNSIYAPFLAYGTGWLAFAHLVLAVAFIGPLRDPIRNKWVLQCGVIACIAVLPLALIVGPLRGIPPPWRLIDCSFGLIGAIPSSSASTASGVWNKPSERNQAPKAIVISNKSPHVPAPPLISTPNLRKLYRWISS